MHNSGENFQATEERFEPCSRQIDRGAYSRHEGNAPAIRCTSCTRPRVTRMCLRVRGNGIAEKFPSRNSNPFARNCSNVAEREPRDRILDYYCLICGECCSDI